MKTLLIIIVLLASTKCYAFSDDNTLGPVFQHYRGEAKEYQGKETGGVLVAGAKHESGYATDSPKEKIVYIPQIVYRDKADDGIKITTTWCDDTKEVCR